MNLCKTVYKNEHNRYAKKCKGFWDMLFFAQNSLRAVFSEQSSASTAAQENKQEWEPLIRDILLFEAWYRSVWVFLKFC